MFKASLRSDGNSAAPICEAAPALVLIPQDQVNPLFDLDDYAVSGIYERLYDRARLQARDPASTRSSLASCGGVVAAPAKATLLDATAPYKLRQA
jgi:hypothetical protein